MNDCALLEAAAKAVGLVGEASDDWCKHAGDNETFAAFCCDDKNHTVWAPLTDDGEAFRLALKLGFTVVPRAVLYDTNKWIIEKRGDVEAATRRAIVRAAAALSDRT